MDGFINLYKPAGMTSHDAVNRVRKIFSTRKVGHAGTLDPAASGVLPVAINRATKFLEYLTAHDKTYRAEILFGTATDSGDLDGEVISRAENFSMPTRDELNDAAKIFVGEIEQTPPKFSAIKIHGRKACDLARKNLSFEMPTRRVKIFRLEILDVTDKTATIEVDCSAGTYIRSLAVDFGARLNLPATLKNLIRLRVGDFALKNSVTFDELDAEKILPIETCLKHLPPFELPENRIRAFLNGLPTTVKSADEKQRDVASGWSESLPFDNFNASLQSNVFRVTSDGKFLGVGKISGGELRSAKIV